MRYLLLEIGNCRSELEVVCELVSCRHDRMADLLGVITASDVHIQKHTKDYICKKKKDKFSVLSFSSF